MTEYSWDFDNPGGTLFGFISCNRRGHIRGTRFRSWFSIVCCSPVTMREQSLLHRWSQAHPVEQLPENHHSTYDNVAGNTSRNVTAKADLTPTFAAGTAIDRVLWWGSGPRTYRYLRPANRPNLPKDTNMPNFKTKFRVVWLRSMAKGSSSLFVWLHISLLYSTEVAAKVICASQGVGVVCLFMFFIIVFAQIII
jgi:hypothetical protein